MAELLKSYKSEIKKITLVPSDGGRFEVSINGALEYSKLRTRRHADPGEVHQLVGNFLQEAK